MIKIKKNLNGKDIDPEFYELFDGGMSVSGDNSELGYIDGVPVELNWAPTSNALVVEVLGADPNAAVLEKVASYFADNTDDETDVERAFEDGRMMTLRFWWKDADPLHVIESMGSGCTYISQKLRQNGGKIDDGVRLVLEGIAADLEVMQRAVKE